MVSSVNYRAGGEKFIAVAKQGRMQLEAQMKLEREQLAQQAQDAQG